ncbi:hypothetical protein ARMSODRAFT_1085535 [Armillaria solidipes]|uniref:Uncharacterized protein n=1 Tax=Armillaria solidipes TaxID=1076256 RepID=A0A2H3BWF5_9AGAR|nr:hypothetical protein ARMSODRAFT_1085535 [Armillaria solidipes]
MSGAQNYTATQDSNQGIVDSRPAGRQPSPQPVILDTVVDRDATGESGPTQELPGVTSKDVHQSTGKPGSGMSSKELRHDGQPGRKKEGLGLEARWGTGGQ